MQKAELGAQSRLSLSTVGWSIQTNQSGRFIVDIIDPRERRLVKRLLRAPYEPLGFSNNPELLYLVSNHSFVKPYFDSSNLDRYTGFHLDIDVEYEVIFPLVDFLMEKLFPRSRKFFVRSGSGNLYLFFPIRDFPKKSQYLKWFSLKLSRILMYFGVKVDQSNSTSEFARRFLIGYYSKGKPFKPVLKKITQGAFCSFSEFEERLRRIDRRLCYEISNRYRFAKPTWRKCLCAVVPKATALCLSKKYLSYVISRTRGRDLGKTYDEVLDISRRYKPDFTIRAPELELILLKSLLTKNQVFAGDLYTYYNKLFTSCVGRSVFRQRFYRKLRFLEGQGFCRLEKQRNGKIRVLSTREVSLWS